MASFSATGDILVIRLVYDGPAESGKTSSLRTLAGSLARRLESPEEAGGRTLFFDWMDYLGGSFEGVPIRCQIVSVPGQPALASRREILLAEADAIVFVADSTSTTFSSSEQALASLRSLLNQGQSPCPGIVVQANKRDQPDALPISELRARLGLEGIAVVESVAISGAGIREAFVLAVRLALDRVRELRSRGALRQGRPDAESAGDLLQKVRRREAVRASESSAGDSTVNERSEPPLAASALQEVLAGEAGLEALATPRGRPATEARTASSDERHDSTPLLPNSNVPSGRVWPPIEGRLLLHAASAIPVVPQRRSDGSWGAQEGAWWFHSASEHEFQQLEEGKSELLRWAQLHAGSLSRLSSRRCLVLSEAGPGSWRLWQIVQSQPSLRQRLRVAFAAETPQELARTLLAFSEVVLRARSLFALEPVLPCLLEVIGEGPAQPVYVGLLPQTTWTPQAVDPVEDDPAFLRRILGPSLRRGLAENRPDVPQILNALSREKSIRGERGPIVETLNALLIGH